MPSTPCRVAPRWLEPPALAAAAERWRELGAVRLEDALAPGLAAELAIGLTRLPLGLVEQPGEIVWAADVAVPPIYDPQLFEPLIHAMQAIRTTLPVMCRAITGRAVVAATPEVVRVAAYRKGSWTERAIGEPAGAIVCTIAVVGSDWPRAWGGHDARVDGRGGVAWCVASAAGTIELADAASVRRVEVLTRRVERIELRALFVPEEP